MPKKMKKDVFVVDDWGNPAGNIASFYTVREAEDYIHTIEDVNPEDVHNGRYAIDAPEWKVNPVKG